MKMRMALNLYERISLIPSEIISKKNCVHKNVRANPLSVNAYILRATTV